jgi:hypothetical protein
LSVEGNINNAVPRDALLLLKYSDEEIMAAHPFSPPNAKPNNKRLLQPKQLQQQRPIPSSHVCREVVRTPTQMRRKPRRHNFAVMQLLHQQLPARQHYSLRAALIQTIFLLLKPDWHTMPLLFAS